MWENTTQVQDNAKKPTKEMGEKGSTKEIHKTTSASLRKDQKHSHVTGTQEQTNKPTKNLTNKQTNKNPKQNDYEKPLHPPISCHPPSSPWKMERKESAEKTN